MALAFGGGSFIGRFHMLRSHLPRWLLASLLLLLSTALGYLGVWLITLAKFSLAWYWALLLVSLGVLLFSLLSLLLAHWLTDEWDASIGGALICFGYLLMAAAVPSGSLLRVIGSQSVCQSTLSQVNRDEACAFLCFDSAEVVDDAVVTFDSEEETYALNALRAPGSSPPYAVWVTQSSSETEGRCVWRHFWFIPERAARRSPLAAANPITGDLVVSPEERLASYHWWFWFSLGVLSLSSFPILYWLVSDPKRK